MHALLYINMYTISDFLRMNESALFKLKLIPEWQI